MNSKIVSIIEIGFRIKINFIEFVDLSSDFFDFGFSFSFLFSDLLLLPLVRVGFGIFFSFALLRLCFIVFPPPLPPGTRSFSITFYFLSFFFGLYLLYFVFVDSFFNVLLFFNFNQFEYFMVWGCLCIHHGFACSKPKIIFSVIDYNFSKFRRLADS